MGVRTNNPRGRPPGIPNRDKATFRERLKQLGCDPVELLARVCNGDLPCGVCHGEGKTRFQPARGQTKMAARTCESCYGSGKERLSPRERREAASDLLDRFQPRVKAIEVTGEDGGPIDHEMVITFVKPS